MRMLSYRAAAYLSRIAKLEVELEEARSECSKWHELARAQAGKAIAQHHFAENFTAAPLLSWLEGIALWKYGRRVNNESVFAAINHLANFGEMTPLQYEFFRGSLNEPLYFPGKLALDAGVHNDLLDSIARLAIAGMPQET